MKLSKIASLALFGALSVGIVGCGSGGGNSFDVK